MLHAVAQQLRHAPGLILRGFDEQFVVHLQYQPRLEAALTQRIVHAHHGQLDDIGRRALHGGVHGGALAELADVNVARF